MCNPNASYWPAKKSRAGTDVEVKTADGGAMMVHVSRPEGEGPYPTVLVLPDYFDPEHYYHDLADQFAAAGYLGVCPNVFHRQGKLPEQSHEAAGQRIGSVGDAQVYADVDSTLAYLKAEGLLGELAICGFCWGGRMSYLVAAAHPETRLLLPFYGHLSAWSGPDGEKPGDPMVAADKINARVVGSYGGLDESIPVSAVREMERRLRDRGVTVELKVYEGAPHCFFRTPEWEEASDDAWSRTLHALEETVAQ